MNQVILATTGRRTSQLGFGCSSLMGATGRKESLALLEHAFDAGIRHFDVAPMYGYGAAEGCLGEFLSRHNDATVTTKYGIPPPPSRGLMRAARRAAASALKLFPSLKKRLASAANNVTAAAPKASFTAAHARTSLDHSLAELRTDRLDLFLLHEAEAIDLTDDNLLRFLEDAVATGKVGAFGCGSAAAKIPGLLDQRTPLLPRPPVRVVRLRWPSRPRLRLHPAPSCPHRQLPRAPNRAAVQTHAHGALVLRGRRGSRPARQPRRPHAQSRPGTQPR